MRKGRVQRGNTGKIELIPKLLTLEGNNRDRELLGVMEADMIDDPAVELQALASKKGYRLKKSQESGRYWLIDIRTGLPELNPADDTPSFNRGTALQFLLESVDVHHPASERAA